MQGAQQQDEGALPEVRDPRRTDLPKPWVLICHVRHAARRRIAAVVDPSLTEPPKTLKPGRRLREAGDTAPCRIRRSRSERSEQPEDPVPVHHAAPTSFSGLSDEEIDTLVALLRKASVLPESC